MTNNAEQPAFVYKPIPLTKRLHAKAYEAIQPSQPNLSQSGRTILVTAGSAGIGYSIAKSFGLAKADRVIITGRTQEKVDEALHNLQKEVDISITRFEGMICEMSDSDTIDVMFDKLNADDVHVDVLVLNHALNIAGKISDQGWEKTWDQFIPQSPKKHYVVNISSAAIHMPDSPIDLYSYSLTKAAGTLLLQKLAEERNPADTQIISFHPGAVCTDQVREKGLTETSMNWDDVNLPGAFAVWCASEEATFLHGRFVWTAWDVDELKSGPVRETLDSDGNFLRIGVHGL
ncbi:short-chain alcohol dehydrogenase/reductase [Fusarium heterosporum]|uniref:Short-chain alcohol dehydrogenase/reductase n=1 Tax=Fusarium heterosporum TaxID=42747 RepID=A0A8H5TME6_FUSHE|nr:short-chain alcohol dehydrogenase/reductase [Fusarium heterosporum]